MSNLNPLSILFNSRTKENLTFSPTLGGTITALTLGKDLYQIMDNDSVKELQKNPLFRGRILFPFNDRIPGGKYTFQGKTYQLPINCNDEGSAIHGFMYNKEVTILEKNHTKTSMFWRTGENNLPGYPFDISLKTDIKLHNGGVTLSFTIKNEGGIPAPYALGWHSYFKTDSLSVLTAAYSSYFETDDFFLPIGNCIPAKGSSYDYTTGAKFFNQTLDHTLTAPPNGISILKNKDYSIKIKQHNFGYTQLFIPPDKKSIAIEPISSKPNSFNSELVLNEGEEYIASISIDIL
jgi:aldose 1-epimerase